MHRLRALTNGESDDCVQVHGIAVYGLALDLHTRCVHWHGTADIVAIRFHCCDRFYPCAECHAIVADHAATVWPRHERDAHALLCGMCGTKMRIDEYLATEACPACDALFNPGCRLHRHLYFA